MAAGGPDQIYVLSTDPSFTTTVVGGSGDDTIHLGGSPPPLVFDPPPYTYQPPPFDVELPPELVYTEHTWNLDGLSFNLSLGFWDTILHLVGANNLQQAAENALNDKVNALIANWSASIPNFQLLEVTSGGLRITERSVFGIFGLSLLSRIEVRVDTLRIRYQSGQLERRSKRVTPSPVTVDPPPFAFYADGTSDISAIQGQLIIQGGDQFEDQGDTVIVHNKTGLPGSVGTLPTPNYRFANVSRGQAYIDVTFPAPPAGSALIPGTITDADSEIRILNVPAGWLVSPAASAPVRQGTSNTFRYALNVTPNPNNPNGSVPIAYGFVPNSWSTTAPSLLTNRIVPRMIQVGEDQHGNPLYQQDVDQDGKPLEDSYLSLEGLGLAQGVGPDTVPFHGVRMQGIEALDLRLGAADDQLIVAEKEFRAIVNGLPKTLTEAKVAADKTLGPLRLSVASGDGNDTITLKQVNGLTNIRGGAGDDTLIVSDRGTLNGIGARVYFNGDADVSEGMETVPSTDPTFAPLLNAAPLVYVNSNQGLNTFTSAGETIAYALSQTQPIVFSPDGNIWVRSAVIGDGQTLVPETGLQERGVQKKDSSDRLLYLDASGNETTTNTGVPAITFNPNGALVYLDAQDRRTFTDTGRPSIVTNLTSGTPVYLDAQGHRTFTVTSQRSMVIDHNVVQEDQVQERGTQERGTQERGKQKTDGDGNPLYLDQNGLETTTNTGIPAITTDPTGQPVYIDANDNRVFNSAGNRPSILTGTTGQLVYLDAQGHKTFSVTGRKSLVTSLDNNDPLLFFDQNGNKTAYADAWMVQDLTGADFNIYETSGTPEFNEIAVQVSADGVNFHNVASVALTRIAGDNQFDSRFIHSYDLAGSGVTLARYLRIIGMPIDTSDGGFDLDAVGLIHPNPNGPSNPSIFWNTNTDGLSGITGRRTARAPTSATARSPTRAWPPR